MLMGRLSESSFSLVRILGGLGLQFSKKLKFEWARFGPYKLMGGQDNQFWPVVGAFIKIH